MPTDYAYQKVAVQIANLIETGIFPLGSKLPCDSKLAESLNTNRASIRDAKIALQAQGYLERKTRSGTYIASEQQNMSSRLPKVAPLELTEARAIFEAEAAALAAPLISHETISQLETYIAIMAGTQQSGMSADEADAAFHSAIARSTNNHMIIFVVESMWKIRNECAELQRAYRMVCDHDPGSQADEHIMIVQALKNRDASAAREAMRAHFKRIIEALIDYSEKEGLQNAKQNAQERRFRFLLTKQLA